MEVVVDTNVVVSAAINPLGPPADIMKAWRAGSFVWIISPPLLDELERVLLSPRIRSYLSWSEDETAAFLKTVREAARIAPPGTHVDAITADPSDNRVLEAASAAQADYVVSGDRHLLNLREYEGVGIVSPVRFAAMLARESL